jgi:hypothetical protein
VPIIFDCTENKRADLMDGVEFGDGGEVLGADWVTVGASDAVLQTACAEV